MFPIHLVISISYIQKYRNENEQKIFIGTLCNKGADKIEANR